MAQLSKVRIVKDTKNFKDDAVWGDLSLLQNSHNDNISELSKLETESKEIGGLVEEGLAKVAAAVTNKGVYTESGASFATVAENIRKIEIGEVDSIFENEFITDEVDMTLTDGIFTFNSSLRTLTDGIFTFNSSLRTLTDGIFTFNSSLRIS